MTKTPFEISVTLNATSQMLDKASDEYENTTAVAPSNNLENVLGYDVELPFLKGFFLQYKRPYHLTSGDKPFSFHTDHPGQLETLKTLAQILPRSVFYALPLVRDNPTLSKTLEQTIFLDVNCLRQNTSRVRIPQNYYSNPSSQAVEAKVKNDDWYSVDPDCCRDKERFLEGINSSESGIEPWITQEYEHADHTPVGVVLQQENEPTIYPEENISVRSYLDDYISEHQLTFSESGLTAGMFAR